MSSSSSEKDEMVNSGEAETTQHNPPSITRNLSNTINSERTLYWNAVNSEVFTVFLCDLLVCGSSQSVSVSVSALLDVTEGSECL